MPFPLFQRLEQLHEEAQSLFHSEFLRGLEHVGFASIGICSGAGYPTPSNSVPFAHAGVDGWHFAFLQEGNRIEETTPVLAVIPGGNQAFVVGEGLHDFLCLGCLCGYYEVARLAGSSKLVEVASETQLPGPDDDLEFHEVGEQVLAFLRTEFSLTPWKNAEEKHARLRKQYGNVFYRNATDSL